MGSMGSVGSGSGVASTSGPQEGHRAVSERAGSRVERAAHSPLTFHTAHTPHTSPLSRPALVLVTDRTQVRGGDLVAAVDRAVAGGVHAAILREKDLPAGELLALAVSLRQVTEGRALLLVNDRVDVALACGADGVQLGETGLPVEAAQRLVEGRQPFLIGRSVHDLEGARRAAAAGADYLLFGNVFATASHPGRPPAGLERLAGVCAGVPCPVIAIGGITAGSAGDCLRAGAQGVAVISAILGSPDPQAAAKELLAAMLWHSEGDVMPLTVNGEPREVPEGTTIAGLLELLKITRGMIAVSRNREILHREQYAQTVLQAGDSLEIVRMVGGG